MPHRLPGMRVLVVEDNPALAYDIDDALSDSGACVIGPALDLPSGLSLARNNRLDGAVLDIRLGKEFVWALARELKRDHVPLLFVSAECADQLPADLSEFVCLTKPAPTSAILSGMSDAIRLH